MAVSAILLIAMGILVTMFFSQIIDNFIYKVSICFLLFGIDHHISHASQKEKEEKMWVRILPKDDDDFHFLERKTKERKK